MYRLKWRKIFRTNIVRKFLLLFYVFHGCTYYITVSGFRVGFNKSKHNLGDQTIYWYVSDNATPIIIDCVWSI